MGLEMPESMDDCLYFTNRTIEETGKGTAWVKRPDCKCGKGKFGKPIKKNGKVDKKAEFYECPACKDKMSLDEANDKLKVEVIYKCPFCGHEGEAETEYKRKSWKGVPSYVFECSGCGEKIGITKKLKEAKKKKVKG